MGRTDERTPWLLPDEADRRANDLPHADAPLAVFHPRYADMSLDAKVTYTFLLNRFLLSRRIGGCRTSKNEEEPSLPTETYRKCLFYGRYKILYEAGTNEACIDAVLNSPLANVVTPPENDTTGRVLRSTRLEDSVYTDLRNGDDSLNQTERTAQKELAAYEAAAELFPGLPVTWTASAVRWRPWAR